MSILYVQQRLKASGFDPGPLDGAWGPKTQEAFDNAMTRARYPDLVKPAPDPELIAQLKTDEGCRLTAYQDTVGIWTVGYGHAHVAPGTVWTQAEAEAHLIEDVTAHNAKLAAELPWIATLDPVRRRVLQNMAFNLGIAGLLGFKNTLEFVRTGQYDKAAAGMLASKWATQVKGRAQRLAQSMVTGR